MQDRLFVGQLGVPGCETVKGPSWFDAVDHAGLC